MKQQNDGAAQSTYFTREAIEAYRIGGDPLHPSMDWADYMYNKFFLQTKNNINISGGTDAVKYFVSIGYLYQMVFSNNSRNFLTIIIINTIAIITVPIWTFN